MRIQVLTTFPEMFDSVMGSSMMKRAQDKDILQFNAFDLRDWTHDRHRTTDDYPYGGGHGLVMKCEPVFSAVESLLGVKPGSLPSSLYGMRTRPKIIFLSPHGRQFDDQMAKTLSFEDDLLFICGHYEGMDERIYSLADEIISIGDYVLTSGELASMVVIDAVVRKIDGVLGAVAGADEESFVSDLLEHPQYTRPRQYCGMEVPDVLLSGDHAKIEQWRREQSLIRTMRYRPDLLDKFLEGNNVTEQDCSILEKNLQEAE